MNEFSLPLAASELIPHRGTMLLVDTLLNYEAATGAGIVLAGSRLGKTFAVESGAGKEALLEEVVLFEIMAQAYACLRGYEDRLAGLPPSFGFLVGVRHFHCHRPAVVNEELTIKVATRVQMEAFFIAEAVVAAAGEIVAEGELKIWLAPPSV